MQAPAGRYKIIERGRRLVTVDTQTGLEIDMLPSSSSRELSGEVRASSQDQLPLAEKQLVPSAPNPAGLGPATSGLDRSARLAILIVGGLVAGFILIITGAWILVVGAMAFAPVRAIVLTAAKTAIARFLDGGGPA